MPRWSSHTKYCNIAIKNNFVGLKTWSRCRNSIVACPALDSQHKVVLQIKFFIFSFAIIVQYATLAANVILLLKNVYISPLFLASQVVLVRVLFLQIWPAFFPESRYHSREDIRRRLNTFYGNSCVWSFHQTEIFALAKFLQICSWSSYSSYNLALGIGQWACYGRSKKKIVAMYVVHNFCFVFYWMSM